MEGCVPRADDGDGASDDVRTVAVGEEVAVAERLQGGYDVWPEGRAVSFEVNEEDEGLGGDGVEDTVLGGSAIEE